MTSVTPGSLWANFKDENSIKSAIDEISAASLRLNRDFRVIRVVRGGMGEVFICESKTKSQTNEVVRFALKTFQKQFFFDFISRAAFLEEATTWIRLTGCLHVMPALGLETIDQRLCIRMPVIEPEEGAALSVREMLRDGALRPKDVLAIALQTAVGMQDATTRLPGLIHGDLKPDNLLLFKGLLSISDFGLSRVFNPTKPGLPMQTTYCYQAPEVFEDPRAVTPSADVYSFGILLYELLTGRCPVEPMDRTAAAKAHRQLVLKPIKVVSSTGLPFIFGDDQALAARLCDLAIACAARHIDDRPGSFEEIWSSLRDIGYEYNLVDQLDWFVRWKAQRKWLRELQGRAAPSLVRSLFQLNEPRLALDFLNELEGSEAAIDLLPLKGTALSLAGQPTEAIEIFEDLLKRPDLPTQDRLDCDIERALALKRIGRFSEAVEILERLRLSVEDEDLALVVTNLAGVYIESNDDAAAVRLLQPFCRGNLEATSEAWGNLGIALARLNKPEEALEALDVVVAKNPSSGEALLWRAKVLMDLLNRYDLAYVSLDLAFDQGFESREWLVRMAVSTIATGRKSQARQMLATARENLGDKLADEISNEVDALIHDLKAEESTTEPRYRMFLRRPSGAEDVGTVTSSVDNNAPSSDPKPSSDFTMPFVNRRFYLEEGNYSLDFYYPLEAPNYIERFHEVIRTMERQSAPSAREHYLRSTPFFITICTSCNLPIMTNRDAGRSLACRRCNERHLCEPADSTRIRELTTQINRILGNTAEPDDKHYLVLALQGDTPEDDAKIISICQSMKFRRLKNRSYALMTLMIDGQSKGTFDRKRPALGFISQEPVAGAGGDSRMPSAVDRVIRQLRLQLVNFRSASLSFQPDDPRFQYDLDPNLMSHDIDKLVAEIEAGPTVDPANLKGLVELLRLADRFEEALGYSRRLVEILPGDSRCHATLGMLELQVGNIDNAIEALRDSASLDPANATYLWYLGHAYEKKGDLEQARHWHSRSHSLGGPLNQIGHGLIEDLDSI